MKASPIFSSRGSAIYIVIITVFFFAMIAGLYVLLVIGVGRQSVAWDAYRQGANEQVQLERVVEEVVQNQRGIHWHSGSPCAVEADVVATLARLSAGGATTYTVRAVPTIPAQIIYPSLSNTVTTIASVPEAVQAQMSPELRSLVGPRAAISEEYDFAVRSTRIVLEQTRDYDYLVRARSIGVPLSRYSICAYDYPSEVASMALIPHATAPASASPGGLVPGRDSAFRTSLQAASTSMPYGFRRRAELAAAYQYVFSQQYFNALSLYAGVTHFYSIDAAVNSTAKLEGMLRTPGGAAFDVGVAGRGQYGVSDDERSAIIIYTDTAGRELELSDSVGSSATSPLFILICGPQSRASGRLVVRLTTTISRPIVLMGSNIELVAAAGVVFNGAMLLDPDSAIPDGTGPVAMRHLSYKAGSSLVAASAVAVSGPMPAAAEQLMPRVLYVLTSSERQ